MPHTGYVRICVTGRVPSDRNVQSVGGRQTFVELSKAGMGGSTEDCVLNFLALGRRRSESLNDPANRATTHTASSPSKSMLLWLIVQ